MSNEKGAPHAIIVYSTSSGPTPLNYAHPSAMTRDQVQDMIGQAMDSFIERQRQENEQFRLSMQNSITTQFSNFSVVLLQNLQKTQMTILGVVVALASIVAPASPPLNHQPPLIEPTPPSSPR